MYDWNDRELRTLEEITRYPALPKFHNRLGDVSAKFEPEEPVLVTEWVEGTHVRLIFTPHGEAFIGDRREVLYCDGDIGGTVVSPVVQKVREWASGLNASRTKWFSEWLRRDQLVVFHCVWHGAGLSRVGEQYGRKRTSFRLIDVAIIPSYLHLMAIGTEYDWLKWRERGNQKFVDQETLLKFSSFARVNVVPSYMTVPGREVPTTMEDMAVLLKACAQTQCGLDSGIGLSSGLVLRNMDRTKIAKIDKRDYLQTMVNS